MLTATCTDFGRQNCNPKVKQYVKIVLFSFIMSQRSLNFMKETIIDLVERRSCRKYEKRQITDEQLDEILKAGVYAPSGMGKQSACIAVIQNQELIDRISKMNAAVMNGTNDPFYGAPTLLVVFADTNIRTFEQDGVLVIGNLLNAAHAVGVDSCYINRAKEVFRTEKGKQMMREWGIPESCEGIGNVILGYGLAEGKKEAAARKEGYIVRVKS